MATTPVNLPSINVPFTDSQGRLNPIWHEFLRSFVTGAVDGTIADPGVVSQVVAGNGLVGGGPVSSDIPLRVGQGSGIVVNADDVSVDISTATFAQGALDDEVLIADKSDNNNIRKTRLRDVAALAVFSGDIDNIHIEGNTISTTDTNGDLNISPNGTGAIVFSNTIHNLNGSTTDHAFSLVGNALRIYGANATTYIDSVATGWRVQAAASKDINVTTTDILVTGLNFRMGTTAIQRSTTPTLTASTTQTQGQGALTSDINEISVCANANDVRTLPAALAGRQCLVINNGAQTLQLFPSSGCNLGAGLNTSTTIVAGSKKLFVAYNTVNWVQVV